MDTEHEKLAAQLRHPQGEEGILTGMRMQETNAQIQQRSLQLLQLKAHDRLLEIGPGNGAHVPALLSSVEGLLYTGIDISETMLEQARTYCRPWVNINKADFVLGNGVSIPYPPEYFTHVLAVNVLYFWENPLQNLQEIHRVMKPGALFCLAFRSKAFMEDLPFAAHGFTLYDADEAQRILEQAGFVIRETYHEMEESIGIQGQVLPKDRILVLAKK